jgi:hypothetical protein
MSPLGPIFSTNSQDSGGEKLEAIDSENPRTFHRICSQPPARVQRTTAWDRWWCWQESSRLGGGLTLRRRSGIV